MGKRQMKAKINAEGMLTLTAENDTELYALKVWHADLGSVTSDTRIPRSGIRVAPFIESSISAPPLPEVD